MSLSEVAPLHIFVLWHPKCSDGGAMARAVYNWFHAPNDELFRAGLGVPVYYRSEPWEPAESAAPRAIDHHRARLNVVVPLVDHHMVSDAAWQRFLTALASQERVAMFPVALHESGHRLSDAIRRVNYLPVDSRGDADRDDAARLERRCRVLRRRLTEVCGRLIQGCWRGSPPDAPAPPLTIFLSHAKVDGTHVAETLKANIYAYGQTRAYYDENDLPIGHAFASELAQAVSADSAAVISVLSDAYAQRPWCRREVALARTPALEAGSSCCWHIQPLLVVDALSRSRTQAMPEFGNAPLIRWQPERADEILDMLFLEVLLVSFHRLRARSIAGAEGRHVISWVPDIPTLLELQARPETDGWREMIYPGHGLPPAELSSLSRYFKNIRLRTFEEVDS